LQLRYSAPHKNGEKLELRKFFAYRYSHSCAPEGTSLELDKIRIFPYKSMQYMEKASVGIDPEAQS
jgi:hypothetical protein